jgi:hypothetical protein
MEGSALPRKILNLIQETDRSYTCQIMNEEKLTQPIEIKSAMQQGCVLYPNVFLLLLLWLKC